MKIISGQTNFVIPEKTALAIGKFDGIHLGHMKLVEAILRQKENGLKAAIFTFDPSIEEIFTGTDVKYLTTKYEKRKIFEALGIDYLIEFPMSKETASIEPEEFISKYLARELNAAYIVCGDDLSFGNKGRGNYSLLKANESRYGFKSDSFKKVEYEGTVISSTYIRNLISTGQISKANQLMGRPYSITARVVDGKHLGRTIGFPTANIDFDIKKFVPQYGVYKVRVIIGNRVFDGITNIGVRPTVSEDNHINAETYIKDFNENIYNQEISLELVDMIRPEMKFESLDELKHQISQDLKHLA